MSHSVAPWLRVGIRARLALVVAVILAPLAGYQAHQLVQQRDQRIKAAIGRVLDDAHLVSERFQDAIDDARSTLDLLSRVPEVVNDTAESCHEFLTKVRQGRPWAAALYRIDVTGRIACSTVPAAVGLDVSKRDWYLKTLSKGEFTVSDFYLTLARKRPTIAAALSLSSTTLNERSPVLMANLELDWFDQLASDVGRKSGVTVLLVDGAGRGLSRYPAMADLVGKDLSGHDAVKFALVNEEGQIQAKGISGQERFYAYQRLPGTDARLLVSVLRHEVLAPINASIREAALLFLGLLFLIGGVIWLAGNRIFVEPLLATGRALSKSEHRYRLLAENTSELIMLGHDDGSRSYISPAVKRLLGYTPEELGAMRLRDYVHPDDLADLYATTRRLGAGEDEVVAVYRSRRKDGGWIWVEGVFRRIPDASLGEPSIVATFRDVSERKAYAQHLEEARSLAVLARDEAERASQSKTDFLASMSHEIRTPLNAIIGFTGLILDRKGLDADLRRQVRLIQSSGSALLSVVNDVLDFSKIEADQIEIVPRPFAPAALIDNVISMTRGLAEPKGLRISANLDSKLPTALFGDADRLRQVLLNLLNNAFKFTARGSVSLDVTCTSAGADAVTLRLAVQDTGIGIPADKLGRLFQRFSQIDGSVQREFGGTGLGLAISKRLVELMGGSISVESTLGRGSTFWMEITLPVSESWAEETADENAHAATSNGRILLAEDSLINQEIACAILKAAGYSVDVVDDGAAAVDAVMNGNYALVLMDVQMPVMDGVTATQRIRALQGSKREVPIIAMTANVLPEQVASFLQAGMNGHIGKPFKRSELFFAIDLWLEKEALRKWG